MKVGYKVSKVLTNKKDIPSFDLKLNPSQIASMP